jgi:lysophospholipase L1-like esterase
MFQRTLILLAAALVAFQPTFASAQSRLPPKSRPAVQPVRSGALEESEEVDKSEKKAKAPFADEIAAFEKHDAKAMPAKGGVVFLGSSSIRMWSDLAHDFPGQNVINRGFGGSTIPDSVRYVDRIVTPLAPRTIVFYAGDNDLDAGHSPAAVLSDFQALVAKVHTKLPSAKILFVAIKPSPARWRLVEEIRTTNSLVRDYAANDPSLGFVDIFPAMLGSDGKPRPELYREDGLHMTRAGYEIWRDAVATALTVPATGKPGR